MADSSVPRDELFITTKLWVEDQGEEKAKRAFDASLARLCLDYLDLFIIHQPFGDYYGSWRAIEGLHRAGTRACNQQFNFYPDRLVDLIEHNEVAPMVDQVECHPFFQRTAEQQLMSDHSVQIESSVDSRGTKQPLHRLHAEGIGVGLRQVHRAGRLGEPPSAA